MPRADKKTREPAAAKAAKPEFRRLADVSHVGRLEHRMSIAANAEERAALARRFDLVSLDELAADLVLKKRGDGVIEVTGRYRARLAQACVVTLEPVPAVIDDEVRLYFSAAPGGAPADADPLDEEAWPERIVDGVIDLGEAVAQLMALALDPYPRAPDAPKGD